MFIFKVTEATPLTGLTGVRQKGGLPGPPVVPSPRISRRPCGLYRSSITGKTRGRWTRDEATRRSARLLPASLLPSGRRSAGELPTALERLTAVAPRPRVSQCRRPGHRGGGGVGREQRFHEHEEELSLSLSLSASPPPHF